MNLPDDVRDLFDAANYAARRHGDAGRRAAQRPDLIDRLSHKYIGQPYPLREDRVVFLVEPQRAWSQAFA